MCATVPTVAGPARQRPGPTATVGQLITAAGPEAVTGSPGCWRRSQLRSPRRRHRHLLGQQHQRSGHHARRHLHHPRRRRRPHLRPAHQRHRHLLGRQQPGQATAPAGTFTTLTAGNAYTCGLRTNGTATCWGYNVYGQATAPAGTFTTLTAGGFHTCGLRTNGTATCWGNNDGGQTTAPAGTFTTLSRRRHPHLRRPHQRHRHLLGRQQLRPDHRPRRHLHHPHRGQSVHTCGLRTNGTATCWGDNVYGQTTAPSRHLHAPSPPASNHTCGIRRNGTATCWGDNGNGQTDAARRHLRPSGDQCGHQQHAAASSPTAPSSAGAPTADGIVSDSPSGRFTMVSNGGSHACAVADRQHGPPAGATTPPARPPRPTSPSPRSAPGANHTCGVRVAGTLDLLGQQQQRAADRARPATFTHRVRRRHPHLRPCSIDSTVACWGNNASGQTAAPSGTFATVAAGGAFSCGLRTDWHPALLGQQRQGTVDTARRHLHQHHRRRQPRLRSRHRRHHRVLGRRRLGQGHSADREIPVGRGRRQPHLRRPPHRQHDVLGPQPRRSEPRCRRRSTSSADCCLSCAIASDGTVECWGSGGWGKASPPPGRFVSVEAGTSHTCGIRASGTTICWGRNHEGQTTVRPSRFHPARLISRAQTAAFRHHSTPPGMSVRRLRRRRLLGWELPRAEGRAARLRVTSARLYTPSVTRRPEAPARPSPGGRRAAGPAGPSRPGRAARPPRRRARRDRLVGSGSLWLRVSVKNGR